VPDAISKSVVGGMTSWRSSIVVEVSPSAAATRSSTGPHASAVDPGESSSDSAGIGFPKPMISNIVNGLSHVA
jgi:hypothetical protein